jgi:dolichol-phosphate mannosyltransferase
MQKPEVSVVVPVYKCVECLRELTEGLTRSLTQITDNYEIIYIDDGSPDGAWEMIEKLAQQNPRVKGVALSRNFGQHPAVFCGLQNCQGEVAFVIDCDLQEDPAYLPLLYERHKEGYDIVFTLRKSRKQSFWRKPMVFIYYLLYNYLINQSHLSMSDRQSSLCLVSRKVLEAIRLLRDVSFHYNHILLWTGFRTAYIEMEYKDRKYGKSSYNFSKLLDLALIGLVFNSDRVLKISLGAGLLISMLSFISGIIVIINYFVSGYAQGWASLFVLMLFSLGVILFFIGVTGYYVAKTLDQARQRPIYIVDKVINL